LSLILGIYTVNKQLRYVHYSNRWPTG